MADVRTLLTQAAEAIAAAQAALDDPDVEAVRDDLVAARLLIATALIEVGDSAHRD